MKKLQKSHGENWKLSGNLENYSLYLFLEMNLNKSQLERTSEIMGNITVTWFSAGVITPLFIRPKNFIEFIFLFALSLLMAGLFFLGSLHLVRRIKI